MWMTVTGCLIFIWINNFFSTTHSLLYQSYLMWQIVTIYVNPQFFSIAHRTILWQNVWYYHHWYYKKQYSTAIYTKHEYFSFSGLPHPLWHRDPSLAREPYNQLQQSYSNGFTNGGLMIYKLIIKILFGFLLKLMVSSLVFVGFEFQPM